MPTLHAAQLKGLYNFAMHDGRIAYSEQDRCLISFDPKGHVAACNYAHDHEPIGIEAFKFLRTDALAALLYGNDPDVDIEPLAEDEQIDLSDLPLLYRTEAASENELKGLKMALALTQLDVAPLCPVDATGNLSKVTLCPMTCRYEPADMLSALLTHRAFGCTDIMPLDSSRVCRTVAIVMRSTIQEQGRFQGRLTTSTPLKSLRVREFEAATHEYLGFKIED